MDTHTIRPAPPASRVVELAGAQRERAAELFAPLGWHLAVAAVLAGAAAGTVVVDRGTSPRGGLLLARHRAYLAGAPSNGGFLAALPSALGRHIAGEQADYLVLHEDRPDWAAALVSLAPGLRGIRSRRRSYFSGHARTAAGAAAAALPAGFRLAEVDAALLDDPSLEHRDELMDEIRSERESAADFIARSFGLALLRDHAVAGWCLSEYNVGRRCEVGIAVAEPYRRRGLARALGTAFARQALAAGVSEIGWHCWEDNAGSCATARALGFTLVGSYEAIVARLARS